MKKRDIKYTDEPIGKVKLIADFLPSPDQLVLKEDTVKVTLALTKESVDFFKKIAKEQHTHYQTMIRTLLEQYTEHYRN
jgi:predicted DNA binding CopG/RHH family protein